MEFTSKIEIRITVEEIIEVLLDYLSDVGGDHLDLPNNLNWEIEFEIVEDNPEVGYYTAILDRVKLGGAIARAVQTEK